MELLAGDEIIIVIPIDNPRTEGREVLSHRSNLKSRLKKRLMNAELASFQGLTGTQKDKLFDSKIRERHSIERNGQ